MIDRIAEIKQRVEAATPGPWVWDYGFLVNHYRRPKTRGKNKGEIIDDERFIIATGYDEGLEVTEVDAEFIAHAREDIPYLLAYIERLQVDEG